MNKLVRITISILTFAAWACLPAFAQQAPHQPANFFDDSSLNQRFDFIITVRTQVLKGYMGYTGSQLNPITQLSVTYQETGRWDPASKGPVIKYEDFWYHKCDPIGCRRYNFFKVAPAGQGIIRFLASGDTSNSSCAIANAATRLLLDIGLNHCSLAAIFVPVDSIDAVSGAFAKLNFLPFTPSPEHSINASLVIYISSEPLGEKRYLYYSGGQL
jgi:hypothetical protein